MSVNRTTTVRSACKSIDQSSPIVVGGYCKSGTTAISKCLAHCLGMKWINELPECWHIGRYARHKVPSREIHSRIEEMGEIQLIRKQLFGKRIVKFPQAVYIPDIIAQWSQLLIVVRDPADTICAYLERKNCFRSLEMPREVVMRHVLQWRYAYRSLQLATRDSYFIVKYEDYVREADKTIDVLSDALGRRRVKQLPPWHSEQANPYLSHGGCPRPVRGIGRSRLSLSESQICEIRDLCRDVMDHECLNAAVKE